MPNILVKVAIGLGAVFAFTSQNYANAQPNVISGPHADHRCQSVSELPDGSWSIKQPVMFGPTVRIESGATVYKGEVIDGVDVGEILQRECRDATRNWTPDAVQFDKAY